MHISPAAREAESTGYKYQALGKAALYNWG